MFLIETYFFKILIYMVNTFLPYADFTACAKSLDNKRLGKQRVEAMQIYNVISKNQRAWSHHPAVLMWIGHLNALASYINEMIIEWKRRGFVNNMLMMPVVKPIRKPWWCGCVTFHITYQANLIRKDVLYKKQFKVPRKFIAYTYLWPSKLSKEQIKILRENKDKILDPAEFTTKL
jgi:hypothetical protein